MPAIKQLREKNSVSRTGTVINWFISHSEFLGNIRIADDFFLSFLPHDKALMLANLGRTSIIPYFEPTVHLLCILT